jgi:hypothetical protein
MIGKWKWSLDFLSCCTVKKVWYGGEDTICWIPLERKSLEVKSYYHVLFTPVRATSPWKSI